MATPIQNLRSARTRRVIETRSKLEDLKREPARLKLAFELLKGAVMKMPELGPYDRFEIQCQGDGFTYLTIKLARLEGPSDPRLTQTQWAFSEGAGWSQIPCQVPDTYLYLGRFRTGHQDALGAEIYHRPILVTVEAAFAQVNAGHVEEVTA